MVSLLLAMIYLAQVKKLAMTNCNNCRSADNNDHSLWDFHVQFKAIEMQKYLVQEQLSGCEKKSLLGAGSVSIESTCWIHLKGWIVTPLTGHSSILQSLGYKKARQMLGQRG